MDISTIFWGRSLSGVGHFWFCFCPRKNFWYCQPTCSTFYLATGFLENPRWNRKINFNKFLTWKKASVQFWPIFFFFNIWTKLPGVQAWYSNNETPSQTKVPANGLAFSTRRHFTTTLSPYKTVPIKQTWAGKPWNPIIF